MRMDRRKRIILLSGGAALTAIAILTTGSYIILNRPDEPETYQDYIRMAEEYMESGDLLSASNSYWEAVEIDSSGTEAYLGLGRIYEEKSEIKKARQVYEAGVRNTGDETLEQQLEQAVIAENQQETARQEQTQQESTEQSLAQHSEQTAQRVGQSASERIQNSQKKSGSRKNALVSVSDAEELPDDREDPDTDVYGTITSEDETPVSDANILLTEKLDDEADGMGAQYSTQTDTDGSYRLKDIPNGTYLIKVTADDFVNREESIVLRSGGEYECNMELVSDVNPEDPDTDVYGTITSENGTPVSDADILLKEKLDDEAGGMGAQYSTQTDTDGSYRLKDIPNGTYLIKVTADDFVNREESIVLRSGGEYECNMELVSAVNPEDPDTDVYGTITSEDETPVSDANILLTEKLDDEADGMGAQYSTQTDTDGSYRLKDIPNGTYLIKVTADDFVNREESIVLRSGGEYECNMELVSDANPQAPGSGEDESQTPGDESQTPGDESPDEPESQTPADGTADDEGQGSMDMAEPPEDPDPETYCVSGIVREEETDEPLEDIEVALIPEGMEDSENRSEWITVRTDETGLYSLTEISAGEYILRIEEDGYEETETKIVVTDADVTEDIMLTIQDEDDIPYEE